MGLAKGDDRSELARRNRELFILSAIAAALNRQTDLAQALHTALVQVADHFGLETGWVWLLREDGHAYLAASQNLPHILVEQPQRMEGECYCLETFMAGDLAGAANINVIECSRLKRIVNIADGLRYHATIPLYAQGPDDERCKLGVLNVASANWRELSDEDLRLLHTIGDMVGIAVERARLFERSAELGAVEERNRLAREIHDTLAQALTAISMQLETADELLTGAPANHAQLRVRAAVQQALKLSQSSLEEARRSVLDLRAAPLEGRNLHEALLSLVNEYEARWQIKATLDVVGAYQPLPSRIEVTLYRIAQEALTNVARYAQASHVALRLLAQPERITLTIEDDGIGFDPTSTATAANHSQRFGQLGMSERARLAGGTLAIETDPGQGTRIEVTLPLAQP